MLADDYCCLVPSGWGLRKVVQQLRDGGYLHIVEERVILPDLEALRRLFDLLGTKEEVRGGFV